jgi:hypothetical protein
VMTQILREALRDQFSPDGACVEGRVVNAMEKMGARCP